MRASGTRIALAAVGCGRGELPAPASGRDGEDAGEHGQNGEGDQTIDGSDDEPDRGGKSDDGREEGRDAFASTETRRQEADGGGGNRRDHERRRLRVGNAEAQRSRD